MARTPADEGIRAAKADNARARAERGNLENLTALEREQLEALRKFRRHLNADGVTLLGSLERKAGLTPEVENAMAKALGQIWLVTEASKNSTIDDVCYQATAKDLALQVLGGLKPAEIVGWFSDVKAARVVAIEQLRIAGASLPE